MMNHLPPEHYLALHSLDRARHLERERRRALRRARRRAERDALELDRARHRLARAVAAHSASARELRALTA